jgi:hypothetical protein
MLSTNDAFWYLPYHDLVAFIASIADLAVFKVDGAEELLELSVKAWSLLDDKKSSLQNIEGVILDLSKRWKEAVVSVEHIGL